MVRAARPEARVVPAFLAVPVALEDPADRRRVPVALVVQEGPRALADLVVQEVPVALVAPADLVVWVVLRPVAPARSPVLRPLRRRG